MLLLRKSLFGLFSTALLASVILSGCGGGSSVSPSNTQIPVKGGFTTAQGTGTPGTTSGAQPAQVVVNVNGTPVTGTMPAGMTIPASGNVIVIPSGSQIINGLTLANPSPKTNGHPGGIAQLGSANPGAITWNGQYLGNLGTDGTLQEAIVLGRLTGIRGGGQLTIVGPVYIAYTGGSGFLQINDSIEYNLGTLDSDNQSWVLPYNIGGTFPINLGYIRNNRIVSKWEALQSGILTRKVYGKTDLTLSWPGVNLVEPQRVENGTVTYTGESSPAQVPQSGISTVTFNFTNPTSTL